MKKHLSVETYYHMIEKNENKIIKQCRTEAGEKRKFADLLSFQVGKFFQSEFSLIQSLDVFSTTI